MSVVEPKRLGELITFKRGYDLPEKNRVKGAFPVISSAGVSGYHNEYKAEGEGVVTGRYGTLGKMYYVDCKYWPHNTALYVKDFKGNDPQYIYYLLSCIGHIRTSDKSAVPGVNRNELHDMAVPAIEDKNTQVAVRNLLKSLDRKIELNNQINAELEAMAKLIYDYWFVQFDFPDANGKPYKSSGGKMVYNQKLKREIPDGWKLYLLSSILKSNYSSIGKNDNYETIEYLDTGSLTKNAIEGTEHICTASDKVPSRAKRIVHKDDILYSTVRPNLCHYGIVKEPLENMIASTGFAQLASKVDWISNDFMFTFLTSNWVTVRLHQIAALAVSAYPSISPTDILDLNIALPKNSSLMANANKQFGEIYSKISLCHKESEKLVELRYWLLPMLMNGQVTIGKTPTPVKKEAMNG